jgi:YidC/Oxa1 family membrane protein insertase
MHRLALTSLRLFLALSFSLSCASIAVAQECGADAPGRAVWAFADEGGDLYQAVFTGTEATLACFSLLNPQYDRMEEEAVPAGVPAWMGAKGPLNLITTWDSDYLPFKLSFLEFKSDGSAERLLVQPSKLASDEGWKAGERRTARLKELYEGDPVYHLASFTPDEIVYVWPNPETDKSDTFVEKRYTKLGGYRIGLNITVYNFGDGDVTTQPQLSINAWEAERQSRGLFAPPPNILEGLASVGDDELEREDGSSLQEEALNPAGECRWFGLANRYFLTAAINRGMTEARCTLSAQANGVVTAAAYRSNPFTLESAGDAMCYPSWYRKSDDLLRCTTVADALDIAHADLFVPTIHNKAYSTKRDQLGDLAEPTLALLTALGSGEGAVLYSFELYLGPKDIDRLKEAEVGLEDSIDFWIVGILAKPMLNLLRWFHSLVGSWALAIIMLTILVKLALLYWTQKSFSQMQRMAKLKPMMDELKEKYGKDKERLNTEMMSLYKREKVNPLGGCLPMLLQMPIWIALYRTIYSSVELYQAPLGGWIQDLSAADPYFVLPVILGASMFAQQKLTPTTMDSAQAKMMLYMMPIMFTVFMLFLPSGLNLYILVNTFLTMAQQFYLRKTIK